MQKHLLGGSNRRKEGFTLLELLIVLVVLAALAAMVIPTLGFVKDQSDTAISAATAQEVLNNLELYKASTGSYPDRLDSLIDENGDFYSAVYDGETGTFAYGTIEEGGGSGFAYYWMANGGGISSVGIHSSTSSDPNAATTPVGLTDTTTTPDVDPDTGDPILDPETGEQTSTTTLDAKLCVMEPGYVASSPFTSKPADIVNTCFPNQANSSSPVVPAGHTLVFLGVGASNGAVGSTMTSAPLAPEKTGTSSAGYDRYIAVFDVQSGGSNGRGQVQLKCVLDPEFNVVARNLASYKASAPSDD